jgi:hypothetical protein
MARKSKIRTWEEVAEAAGLTVRELRELADAEPRLAAVLKNYPVGVCPSGIPKRPEEYAKSLLKQEENLTEESD